MNLLILTDGIFPFVVGGMQRHSHYLVKYMALRGHQITLAHCVPQGQPIPSRGEVLQSLGLPESADFRSVCVPFPRLSSMPGHYLRESYAYSRILFDRLKDSLDKVDFIYAKGFSGWYFLEMKRKKGAIMPPIGVKFHGYEMFQPAPDWRSRLGQMLLKGPVRWMTCNADLVFSYGGKISDIIRELGVPSESIIEVPTGIDRSWLRRSEEISESDLSCLFIGRNERRKGLPELHKALTVLGEDRNFRVEFIGPIPPSVKLKLPGITYHGQITDSAEIMKIMDRCSVLLVPSHSEGMPNVIMEGMSRGLAIMATDVGAVAAQVDSNNGWLMENVSADLIRNTLMKIMKTSPEELIEKRKKSIARVSEHFIWESVAERVDNELTRRLPIHA